MASILSPESIISAVRMSARDKLVKNVQGILEDEMRDVVKEAAEQLVSSYEMQIDDIYEMHDDRHIIKILLEYKKGEYDGMD